MTRGGATRKTTTGRPTRGRNAAAEVESDTKEETVEEMEVMETDATEGEELNDELLDDPADEHAEGDEEVEEDPDEEHLDENGHEEEHEDAAEAADTSVEVEEKEETTDASEKKETTEGESAESKTKEGEEQAAESKDENAEKEGAAKPAKKIMVSAFFEMEKFEDAAELAPFVKNCARLNIRLTGKAATDKAVDVSMYYESEHYKEDLKLLRELKIRGKAVEKLVVRGEPVEPPAQVIVNNIPEDTTDDLLQMLFPKAKKITLPKTKDGKNKGCAMLVFESRSDAEECITENAGINIEENTLTMEISKKEDPYDSRKRSGSHASGGRGHDSSKRPRYDAHRSTGGRTYGASDSRRVQERPRSGVSAQKMAGDMARKMHQMQERMTERIITQVASQIGLDQRDKRDTDRWGGDRRQQYQARGRDDTRRSQGYGSGSGSGYSYGNSNTRRRGGLSADMY